MWHSYEHFMFNVVNLEIIWPKDVHLIVHVHVGNLWCINPLRACKLWSSFRMWYPN